MVYQFGPERLPLVLKKFQLWPTIWVYYYTYFQYGEDALLYGIESADAVDPKQEWT